MSKVSRSLARGKLAVRSALLAPSGPGFIKPGFMRKRWAGCTDSEVVEEVRTEWDQAQLCLNACGKLGGST